jgi:hypothetical protein
MIKKNEMRAHTHTGQSAVVDPIDDEVDKGSVEEREGGLCGWMLL